MGRKLTDLPVATSIADTDKLLLRQGDVSKQVDFSRVQTSLDTRYIKTLSLQEAIAATSAEEGNLVRIADRDNGVFEYKTGQTANTFNIVQSVGDASLALVLEIGRDFTIDMVGASPSGTDTNNALAINLAFTLSKKVGGQEGTYLVDSEIIVLQDYFNLATTRKTIFKATSTNQIILHWSASHGTTGGIRLNGDLLSGVIGFSLTPEDKNQTTTRVDQNYNLLNHIYTQNCFIGKELQAGPKDGGGADSGCWYNEFDSYLGRNNTIGLQLNSPANAASSPNRNKWFNLRVGEGTNTAIWIKAGDSNEFHGGSCEGVNSGTSPRGTPTAIVIENQSDNGADNNHNRFFGMQYEACDIDVVNRNPLTEFYGSNISTGFSEWTTRPKIIIGGSDPAETPQILPWGVYQANGQLVGVDNLVFEQEKQLSFQEPIFDKGFKWIDYVITTSNTGNIASILNSASKFHRVGKMVDWHFRIEFQATASGTTVTIDVPELYEDALYRTGFTEMRVPIFAQGAGGESFVTCRFGTTGTQVKIAVPAGNWDTVGSTNKIHGMLRYHSA